MDQLATLGCPIAQYGQLVDTCGRFTINTLDDGLLCVANNKVIGISAGNSFYVATYSSGFQNICLFYSVAKAMSVFKGNAIDRDELISVATMLRLKTAQKGLSYLGIRSIADAEIAIQQGDVDTSHITDEYESSGLSELARLAFGPSDGEPLQPVLFVRHLLALITGDMPTGQCVTRLLGEVIETSIFTWVTNDHSTTLHRDMPYVHPGLTSSDIHLLNTAGKHYEWLCPIAKWGAELMESAASCPRPVFSPMRQPFAAPSCASTTPTRKTERTRQEDSGVVENNRKHTLILGNVILFC